MYYEEIPELSMTFWIATTAFIATNVDDLFLLSLWFVKRTRFSTVLLGQLAGFSGILLLSLVGYWGVRLLPQSYVHWLGFAPIAIGIKQLISTSDKVSRVQAESVWNVAAVTFANGSDNLAVYIPLFGRYSPSRVALIVIIFYLLLFLYVIGTNVATSRIKQSDKAHSLAHRIAPIVIIGIGLVILLSQ